MKIITPAMLNSLFKETDIKILKTTYDRPKLLESTKGEMIKIFYPRKRRYSSNRIRPYALRFINNASNLKKLTINAPTISKLEYCPQLQIYVVYYNKLSGKDIREIAIRGNIKVMEQVAAYIALLHEKGVFFRSIHLENLLYQEDKTFALLDIVDIIFKNKPLSFYLRFRNLKHLFLIVDDLDFWNKYGIRSFLELYLSYANIDFFTKTLLKTLPFYTKLIHRLKFFFSEKYRLKIKDCINISIRHS